MSVKETLLIEDEKAQAWPRGDLGATVEGRVRVRGQGSGLRVRVRSAGCWASDHIKAVLPWSRALPRCLKRSHCPERRLVPPEALGASDLSLTSVFCFLAAASLQFL